MNNMFLANQHILVTRPSPQGEDLCRILESHGAYGHHVPTLDIQSHRVNLKFFQPDIAIFISVNAVKYYPLSTFSPNIKYFSVGAATSLALMQRGVISQHAEEMNSEGLLALPDLQHVQNKQVAIFCGVGGRDLLLTTLRERGALCQRYEVYQRHCAMQQATKLQELIKAIGFTAVICTSVDNLLCLEKLAGCYVPILHTIPLLVVSSRIAAVAKKQGFLQVIEINGAFDNSAIVNRLIDWGKEHAV